MATNDIDSAVLKMKNYMSQLNESSRVSGISTVYEQVYAASTNPLPASGTGLHEEKRPDMHGNRHDKTDKRGVFMPYGTYVGFVASGSAHTEEIWPDPQPLETVIPDVPPFSIKMLPEALQDYCQDYSSRIDGASPDFLGVSLMVSAASLIGTRAAIQPKELDNWRVFPILWGACVGLPSTAKTPLAGGALALLRKVQDAFDAEYSDAVKAHGAESSVAQLEIEAKTKEARAAIKNDRTAALRLMEQIEFLKASGNPPARRRTVIMDSTPEHIAVTLADASDAGDAGPGLLVFRDELAGWLARLANTEDSGVAAERAFYLQAFNGDWFEQGRITRKEISLKRFCLCVMGGVQPDRIRGVLNSRNTGDNDGLLERIQLVAFPNPAKRSYTDRKPDVAAYNRALESFTRLSKLEHDEAGEPVLYRFAEDAQECYVGWYEQLLCHISEESGTVLEATLGKFNALVPKLALVIHLADGCDGFEVGINALLKALSWADDYLLPHITKLNTLAADGDAGARTLLAKLGKLPDTFTASHFRNKNWSGLCTAPDRQQAIDALVETGYLRTVEVQDKGGRPAVHYIKHPKFRTVEV